MFEQELLEQKAAYESKLKDEGHENQNNKLSGAKLPKLPITKFNGKYEAWLPFWGKFSSEIDSASLPTLARFLYLKDLLEPSVREGIDGLPFTEKGYLAAKETLKAEYGQYSEIVNAYIKNIGLVAVRSQLAKPQTRIPRLELLAAHMAVNLVKNVKEAITGFPVNEITCWSDSTVILYWLQGTETYKQFVANRVKKIQSHEDVVWRYVPSGENPANMGSCGDQSNKRELWVNGPKWLQDPDTWPSNIVAEPSIKSRAETKPAKELVNVAVVQQNERDEVLVKFGLQQAVRVCSWIYRFENNALRSCGADRVEGPLTTKETNGQRTLFIKQAQRNDGCDEDRTALNLKPNEMGVLVCHGQVQGELPIYMPDSATLAQKIIEEAHMLTLHGGIGLTMTQVWKRYWIPRLRRLNRKMRKKIPRL